MKKRKEVFRKVTDENGEAYFCPMNAQSGSSPAVEPEACVEASTVERYSGNIDVSE